MINVKLLRHCYQRYSINDTIYLNKLHQLIITDDRK